MSDPIVNQVVDRQHVSTTPRQIIEKVYSALSQKGRAAEHRDLRKTLYRDAIERHKANRKLYSDVISGNL